MPPKQAAPEPVRTIIHVDMDAFFASVEQRDDPALQGRPVLVGRLRRGVVCAASYQARRFGCRSAMPMAQALRQCPGAVVVAPRFSAYQAASQAAFAIFARYTPLVEGLSLDEAFLDVTGSLALFGPARAQASAIRAAIKHELQLPCSAGVAPSKFVAKLASEWAKPDGLAEVTPEQVASQLAPLLLTQMLGVGAKLAAKLTSLGLRTFSDLRAAVPAELAPVLGGAEARRLVALAWGRDERPVVSARLAKSIGAEETLADDCQRAAELLPLMLHQTLRIASSLAAKGLYATGVRLKLKSTTFALQTRQRTLARVTCEPDPLFAAAKALLAQAPLPPGGVRLVGLAAFGLTPQPSAPALFVDRTESKSSAVEAARLAIEQRFGPGRLTRAAVLEGQRPDRAAADMALLDEKGP